MITFFSAIVVLLAGYFFYGKLVENIFLPTDEPTPAIKNEDGIDFVPMRRWRVFLIQLLNIAGTGPIFGALMGAVFGPVVFFWIVLGSIFGGAVHDYFSGMISLRMNGASVADMVGRLLGNKMKLVLRIVTVVLLILVGAVFITSPAALIAQLTPQWAGPGFWASVIILYYILATLLPIDKLIGRLYPFFGIILIIMAAAIAGGLVLKGYKIPEISLKNLHPGGTPVWPYMFITVACGAVSGFHATQSPMMARCLMKEKEGRSVFYGAMIAESVIALVWAAAGVAFYQTTGGLNDALTSLGQSGAVYDISVSLLGAAGGALAVIGVVICPVSSGDTAFRSARLVIADWFKINQTSLAKRLAVTLPLLAVGGFLTQIDFDIVWRYFSWSNQTLAMIVLWAEAVYIFKNSENKSLSLIAAIPAAFMSAVSLTYILMAKEGFKLPASVSYPAGIAFAIVLFTVFIMKTKPVKR